MGGLLRDKFVDGGSNYIMGTGENRKMILKTFIERGNISNISHCLSFSDISEFLP